MSLQSKIDDTIEAIDNILRKNSKNKNQGLSIRRFASSRRDFSTESVEKPTHTYTHKKEYHD